MANPPRLTSRDIAQRAGVSQTTVSLVMRDAADGRVSPRTQARVREVVDRLGYRVSTSARSLRSRRALMLGLVIPDVTDPFFGAVLRGAQSVGAERGYTVAMIESASPSQITDALAATRAALLDGLLVHSPSRVELAQARAVEDRLVVIDAGRPRNVSWIRYDVARGVQLMLDHLERLGHLRIAHVAADRDRPTFIERAREVHRYAGARLVAHTRVPLDLDAGRSALRQFLRSGTAGATALVCDTDSLAAMAYAAARELELSVPAQMSLTAFNDTVLTRALGLTCVNLPAARAGHDGAHILLDLIDGGRAVHRTLPVTLIDGTSTAPPPPNRRRRRSG